MIFSCMMEETLVCLNNMNIQISYDEYMNTSPKQAYEWVKTKHWNFKTFERWLEIIIAQAEIEASTRIP